MQEQVGGCERKAQRFFQLVRYSIGTSEIFPDDLTEEEWKDFFAIARKQSLLGVLFYGIQKRAPSKLEKGLLLKWYAVAEMIRQSNMKVNRAAVKLSDSLKEQGFLSCILKGQGNTLNYPDPYIRMSGDIDAWVMKKAEGRELTGDALAREVIRYARGKNPGTRAVYHHVDLGEVDGVEVEMHYRPSFMHHFIRDRRMQRWFDEMRKEQFSHVMELPDGAGRICVPTHAFNRIYQMGHLSRHVIHVGIGLRHIVDYYYVLKQGFTEEERVQDEKLLKRLGLYEMAAAVMYVLKEVLHMDDRFLLVPVDERRGKFLLHDVMLSGNFGQYDADGNRKRVKNRVMRNVQRLMRDVHLMCYFPSECLWEPLFRVWHFFFWRSRFRACVLR